MFALDPSQWLLAGLALILLVLLCLMMARRWHQASIAASHYRTASGRLIAKQTENILRHPMAVPRRHLTSAPAAPVLHTRNSRAFWTAAKCSQINTRARTQAQFDWAQHGRSMPGPYTAGTIEHAQWRAAYDAAFQAEGMPAAATVQTAAQPSEAVAA
ncbi:MAG: hypothetical protein V4757_02315 [Pseudomonadota bacterium]